ncbi:hypothetical protein MXD63_46430, partial [Frankia sp. Cpl3]|nr:hypothetical protein [Frankia sp. Cpl3]
MQKAYYRGEKEQLEPIVRQLWQELALLPLYQQYGGALNPFFALLLSGSEWQADKDIRHSW